MGMGQGFSRRNFLKTTAAGTAAVAAGLSLARSAHAAGPDEIKIAVVGCGGRGTGAAVNAMTNKAGVKVKLVAMADPFKQRIESSLRGIQSQCKDMKDAIDVPESRQFVGLECHKGAIECADMVLLCSPPGFRPWHFEDVVKAGKHAFVEKPVATDAPGIRRLLAANEEAKKKGLYIASGHHLRHEDKHREVIKRIHDGLIGDIHSIRVYFNSSGVWVRPRKPGQTELEYQVNNWYYFTWLSGDNIVEQHAHDIDVGNWIMKDAHPVEANGMGGRQVRMGKDVGEIFDHHYVEFTYENGTKMYSQSRHIPGTWESFSEHAHGSKGRVDIEGHGSSQITVLGQQPVRFKRGEDGHQVEMDDFFAAIRAGTPYNETDWAANSSMTAIMGRMATYSGKIVTWDAAFNSQLNLAPKTMAFDAEPSVKPLADGTYACAMPGMTKAW